MPRSFSDAYYAPFTQYARGKSQRYRQRGGTPVPASTLELKRLKHDLMLICKNRGVVKSLRESCGWPSVLQTFGPLAVQNIS